MIAFICPSCRAMNTRAESMAGMKISCPCGQRLLVPSPARLPARQPTLLGDPVVLDGSSPARPTTLGELVPLNPGPGWVPPSSPAPPQAIPIQVTLQTPPESPAEGRGGRQRDREADWNWQGEMTRTAFHLLVVVILLSMTLLVVFGVFAAAKAVFVR